MLTVVVSGKSSAPGPGAPAPPLHAYAATTGFRHSAKAIFHSAKPLPSAALGKAHTAKN